MRSAIERSAFWAIVRSRFCLRRECIFDVAEITLTIPIIMIDIAIASSINVKPAERGLRRPLLAEPFTLAPCPGDDPSRPALSVGVPAFLQGKRSPATSLTRGPRARNRSASRRGIFVQGSALQAEAARDREERRYARKTGDRD